MSQNVRVLFVEDDILDQIAFKRLVKEESLPYEFTIASSVSAARRALGEGRFDVILVDHALADGTGLEAVQEHILSTPTIFVTGTGCEETAVKVMKAGAFDYLVKDHDRNYLKVIPISIGSALEDQRTKIALKESEERYRDLFENASDLIQSVSPDGHFIYTNPAWSRALGYSLQEIAELTAFDVIHPDSRAHCADVFARVLQGENVGVIETTFLTKRGRSLHLEGTTSCQFHEGKPVATRGIFHDVTERKRFEKELIEAKLRAQSASEAKGQFLAHMSHEIRTPINGILGMTNLLFDTPLDPQQKEYAEAISRSGQALLAIINDILDFSKIEAGKLDFEILDINVSETLQDAVEMLTPVARNKGLTTRVRVDDDVPERLRGDPGRLRQVLSNLLSNAIKFTDQGDINLHIAMEKETQTNATLRFSVQDTGIGISIEAQQRLFQAFSQGESSTRRKYGGTGLGLAISKQLVQAMGGEIHVESTPEKGSTFWFTVGFEKPRPSSARAVEGGPSHTVPAEANATPTPRLLQRKPRILVAEDNSINQKVAIGQLSKLGYVVDCVADGAEVLEALEHISYDIILMDCQMPEVDGYEATRKIRALERTRGPIGVGRPVHIIALTAHAMQGERDKCLNVGMNDYLAKPVRLSDLKAALERWSSLDAHPSSDPTATRSAGAGATDSSVGNVLDHDSANPGVELERLREVCGYDPQTIREFVELYFAQADELIAQMKDALRLGTALEVKRCAHKLCGASSLLGMGSIVPALRELEQLGAEDRLPEAAAYAREAEQELERIRRFIQRSLPL